VAISPHRPPVTLPFQSRDRPITQERSSAALGKLDGREHGVLAAHVTALRIEQGDITLANQVLGKAPLCLLSRHDFERKATLPARSHQGSMIGVVVIHDGHHAGDLQEGGPAVRFQLAPQVAGALQQGRVMPTLGIHHAEHAGLTRVRRERPRDRKPVDANYPQAARGQLPARHAPDGANPNHHDISLNDSHRVSIVPSGVSQTPLDEQEWSPGNYPHPNCPQPAAPRPDGSDRLGESDPGTRFLLIEQ
jgi:hypothetical protein